MKKEKIHIEDLIGVQIPSAPEIEEAVLGSMMSDASDAADAFAELSADDFGDATHRKIYETMVMMHQNGCSIDVLTVSDKLKSLGLLEEVGGPVLLAQFLSCNGVGTHVTYHRCILKEKRIQRQIILSTIATLQEAQTGDVKVGELVERAMSRMENACELSLHKKERSASEIAIDVMREIDEIQKGKKITGIWTGFRQLDTIMGPMKSGMYIILAGRTSHGKTQFAANIINNVACKGTPVGLFSLEMGDTAVIKRLMSIISGIGGDRMNRPGLSENEMRCLQDAAKTIGKMPVFIDETAAISINEFQVKAKRMVRVNHVALIIIDYLQLITAKDCRAATREQEVAYISRTLKATAKELCVPIIALAQLSRSAVAASNYSEPRLSDLRESGSLEQDADLVFFVHRPDNLRLDGSPETKIIVAKNRNGRVGTVEMLFDSQRLTFTEHNGDLPVTDTKTSGFKVF